jgi:hypothetical protein
VLTTRCAVLTRRYAKFIAGKSGVKLSYAAKYAPGYKLDKALAAPEYHSLVRG